MRVKTVVPVDQMSTSKNGPLDKKFEMLVNETSNLWHVPGVSIAVVDGDNVYSQVTPIHSHAYCPCTHP